MIKNSYGKMKKNNLIQHKHEVVLKTLRAQLQGKVQILNVFFDRFFANVNKIHFSADRGAIS